MTREQWLNRAVDLMRDGIFRDASASLPHGIDAVVPQVKVSVGFPGGGSARKRIGEAWHPKSCAENVPQVFISPVLDNPVRVLDVLAHELIHTIVPDAGHKKPLKQIAVAIGLTGKMTATVASPELEQRLNALSIELGAYPHSAINLKDRKKQGTRLNKVVCPDCGYTCRVTAKWIESTGAPICPCNNAPMAVT